MKHAEIAVIGGGPAGLMAALAAAEMGAKVTLVDRNSRLGGQLVKQTHKFFGSEKEYASIRGIDIGRILATEVHKNPNIETMLNSTVVAYYPDDGVLGIEVEEKKWVKMKAERIVVATGASEKYLLFENNDLPGIYGAGAVQTLMNEHGVVPGKNVLMVGAGNIGLIVSYQLMQAGVNVKAIIDAAPSIGGYWVHASKVARLGVPILTSYTVKAAYPNEMTGALERAVIWRVDDRWQPVPGTEKVFNVDVMCIAVGLSPLAELLWQAGCKMMYVPELGGHVPVRNDNMETTVSGIYVAGDVAGVEEASSAMMEGRLAGLSAAKSLGYDDGTYEEKKAEALKELENLRSGPVGGKIRKGLAQLAS
ncbi:NAD(P)/FAD-dependent oxidoreductase [Thermosediminibacter litoriperuensis]|uniref:Sarcosine oxidase subunit alpha n=1 Tax=Thermosediminibacter litoriperuensis TaxID=291989 RepID=A0A5S5ANW8_9FIRM|nr:NAD(P)/FAD-dependent oxidoreductase [Thermosediminibacter litoriperuensis]TYP53319.1 sarcosine oxidase subunit alpha [Thermosediminibacter litoriperuensis]